MNSFFGVIRAGDDYRQFDVSSKCLLNLLEVDQFGG